MTYTIITITHPQADTMREEVDICDQIDRDRIIGLELNGYTVTTDRPLTEKQIQLLDRERYEERKRVLLRNAEHSVSLVEELFPPLFNHGEVEKDD